MEGDGVIILFMAERFCKWAVDFLASENDREFPTWPKIEDSSASIDPIIDIRKACKTVRISQLSCRGPCIQLSRRGFFQHERYKVP